MQLGVAAKRGNFERDAFGFDEHGKQLAERPNPMTGPFFVEGAVAGDTLAVRIDRMTVGGTA